MTTVQGRRVADYDAIEKQGDYAVSYAEDGRISSVVFADPGFTDYQDELCMDVVTGPGAPEGERPRWEVTEDAQGRITVSPSFRSQWKECGEEKCFHCFLRGGVFEVLDDCVGAVFG